MIPPCWLSPPATIIRLAVITAHSFLAARGQPGAAAIQPGERSAAYYRNHPDEIRLDLRWKDEFAPDHAALFEQMAGTVNQPMKWGI